MIGLRVVAEVYGLFGSYRLTEVGRGGRVNPADGFQLSDHGKVRTSMPVIPQKRYYKISEVSSLTDLESHVLRFWEGEFPAIRPKRTESGQRMYRRRDIEVILEIKRLLHDERYTIEGAKKMLGGRGGKEKESPHAMALDEIQGIIDELQQIRAMV